MSLCIAYGLERSKVRPRSGQGWREVLPDGKKAACCWNCMLAKACWYWSMPVLNMLAAPLAFSSAGRFGKGGMTLWGIPCSDKTTRKGGGGNGGRSGRVEESKDRKGTRKRQNYHQRTKHYRAWFWQTSKQAAANTCLRHKQKPKSQFLSL